MGYSKNYLAPLGLAAIGALFGIGHFGGLHKTFFGADNETETTTTSYYKRALLSAIPTHDDQLHRLQILIPPL